MNKCHWFQWELFVSCSGRLAPWYHCCSLFGSWYLDLCSNDRANPAANFLSVSVGFVLCFYWTSHWLLGRNFPSGLLFHYRSLWGFLHFIWHIGCQALSERRLWSRGTSGMHWELRSTEWAMLQMQKQEQHNKHIQQHEIPFLHFAHPHCCSWQRESTCPSVIPQPEFSSCFHFGVLHSQLPFHRCPSMQACANQF